MRKILCALCLAGLLCLANEPLKFQLANGGKPAAQIVVAADAHPAVKYAGEELQKWVKAISGAELPIVAAADEKLGSSIILAVKPEGYAGDLAAIGDTDGYAVRPGINKLVILGGRPKGVLNGVFRLLFKNTDIIWARPSEELGTSYSNDPNLALTYFNYRDIPVYILRGWQMGSGRMGPNEVWQVRNTQNWSAGSMAYQKERVKFDPILEFGGGHNLCGLYIKESKYYATHPEYYPLIEGKRVRHSESHGGCQLCFTNKELQKVFISEIDAHYKKNPNYDTYRIMIEDNYNLCECPECMKPITLADGTVVKPDDTAFRSTQFFLWLNPIAKHIKDNYHKNVLSFAYFFTEIPPKCPVEDNISLSFCPIYKNSKHDILAPENELSFAKLDGWLKITPNVTWREYYGLCAAFPRPMDVVATADWRYANSRGVTRTYSEMRPDGELGGHNQKEENIQSWDINCMYFWVMANTPWDPNVNTADLRKLFLDRYYGAAAADVAKFYALIEDSWFSQPGKSVWSDKPRGNWIMHVVKPGLVEPCRAALTAALAKCDKPNGKKNIERIIKVFDAATIVPKYDKMKSLYVTKAPAFDPLFTSGDWARTVKSENFLNQNGTKLNVKTEVRILHDDKNFYVGFLCNNPNLPKLQKNLKSAGQKRDTWCGGEKAEMFFTGLKDGKLVYYQIVITPNGNIYDGCLDDKKWDGNFDVKLDKRGDSWSMMVTIPYKTLGLTGKPDKPLVSFMRYYSNDDKTTTVGYWNDMAPHSIANFTELELVK